MTVDQLVTLGAKDEIAHKYITHLNKALHRYGISTPIRLAHFLAQRTEKGTNYDK